MVSGFEIWMLSRKSFAGYAIRNMLRYPEIFTAKGILPYGCFEDGKLGRMPYGFYRALPGVIAFPKISRKVP